MLTYDPKSLQQEFARARSLTTDNYRPELVKQQEAVQKGHPVVNEYWVTDSTVLSATRDSATMLLFMQGHRGGGDEERLITATVRVSLSRANGHWLVDNLDVVTKPKPRPAKAPAPPAPKAHLLRRRAKMSPRRRIQPGEEPLLKAPQPTLWSRLPWRPSSRGNGGSRHEGGRCRSAVAGATVLTAGAITMSSLVLVDQRSHHATPMKEVDVLGYVDLHGRVHHAGSVPRQRLLSTGYWPTPQAISPSSTATSTTRS